MEDLIDRKDLLFKAKTVYRLNVNGSEGKLETFSAVSCTDIMEAPCLSRTVCGYNVDELVRFVQAMRLLGVEERDIKNFLDDSERICTTLIDKIAEEMGLQFKKPWEVDEDD